jgi:hypothetical protein
VRLIVVAKRGFVGIPLAWGVIQTIFNAMASFR